MRGAELPAVPCIVAFGGSSILALLCSVLCPCSRAVVFTRAQPGPDQPLVTSPTTRVYFGVAGVDVKKIIIISPALHCISSLRIDFPSLGLSCMTLHCIKLLRSDSCRLSFQ